MAYIDQGTFALGILKNSIKIFTSELNKQVELEKSRRDKAEVK
jgi:hypothetical protein